MTQLIGYFLVSLPFIIIFSLAWATQGLSTALGVFGVALSIIITIAVGVNLIHG